jgi:phosphoenolpyruvate---glycerone phosphotransferase subunit DhaM
MLPAPPGYAATRPSETRPRDCPSAMAQKAAAEGTVFPAPNGHVRRCLRRLILNRVMHSDRVSLVLVSHSADIVRGLEEMLRQIAGPDVAVFAVGGVAGGSLGTDGTRVLEAMQAAARRGDTVVLVDLGSAVLSVRAALAELPAEERERITVADAPIVEGAVAAAVAASTGAGRAEVAAAAEEARRVPKL